MEVEIARRKQEGVKAVQEAKVMERKSQLNREEIERLKELLERERRDSMLSLEGTGRRIQELEQENDYLEKEISQKRRVIENMLK